MIKKNSSHAGFISASRRSIKAFTLVELLVVVLIIGILAAVAVPMYKRAVLKSQFSTLMPLAKNLWEGNEIFYLNNGEYAASVDELDVSAPADPKVQATLGDEEQHQYVRVSKTDVPNRITMYQKHSPNFADETHCEALLDNASANWLCENGLQGTFVGNKFGYAVYSLSPDTVGSLARTYYDKQGSTLSDGDVCIDTEGTASLNKGCAKTHLSNGARCVSETNQSYGCLNTTAEHYGICEGNTGNSCGGASRFTDHSTCIGNAGGACYWAHFDGYSVCEGNKSGGCESLNTVDNHSVCYANVSGSCNNTVSRAGNYTNYSSCVGGASNTCTGSKFKTNSTCVANAVGACTGATYDATSYCTGNFCPSGASSNTAGKVWYRGEGEDWPDTRESILVDQES